MSTPNFATFPLTPFQMRMWLADRLSDSAGAAHIPLAWMIEGELIPSVLQAALQHLLAKHPALRCHIAQGASAPYQWLGDGTTFILRQQDLSARTLTSAEISALQQAEALRPFQLEHELPLRANLLCLAPQRYLLLLTLHHVASDGHSVALLLADLQAHYAALHATQAATKVTDQPLAQWAPTSQSNDSADAQNQRYWQQILANLAPANYLRFDKIEADGGPAQRQVHRFELDAPLRSRLHALARDTQTTLFSLVASALNLQLQRYSQQRDICIAYAVTTRTPQQAQAVGCFINTLLLRSQIEPHESFVTLAKQIRQAVQSGKRHASTPLEAVTSRPALAQVLLNFNPHYEPALNLAGVQCVALERVALELPFALNYVFADNGTTLLGRIEYNASQFDTASIVRMAGHLQTLLQSACQCSTIATTPVDQLEMLSTEEQRHLLQVWNPPPSDKLPCRTVQSLFEQQVVRTPNAIAVQFGQQQLSYAELNQRANQLAHFLRAQGVRPDMLIGLCVERSLEMVTGLLAILKAGAAYLPLDPDYPVERLHYMLSDSAAPILLSQQHLLPQLPTSQAQLVLLDQDWPQIASYSTHNPVDCNLPLHLAYCIYTSGSTGRPKGTLNSHAGFVNLLQWYCSAAIPQAPQERVMLSSSLSFDLTQKNIVGPLTYGACLILPLGGTADLDSFQHALTQHHPSRINCAPSALRLFREQTNLASLCSVVLGGEAIDDSLVKEFDAMGIHLVNSYGPTECADVALYHLHQRGAQQAQLPIGRPLPQVQVRILDPHLRLVPIGIVGEIHIAGIGVGRGYLHRPDLTAEKFIPDPFGPAGSRMYKTGDLGHYRADGEIIFLGRIDHQVKIRGFRIEIGEIEAALLALDAVRQAAVSVKTAATGEKCLVAYLAAKAGHSLQMSEVRQQLAQRLPDYMLPSFLIELGNLALSPNGKVDRTQLQALPLPERDSSNADTTTAEELTPTLRSVLQILPTILPQAQAKPDDELVALGFHSLLLLQLASKCKQEFGVTLKVRELAKQRTPRKLASWLDQARKQSSTKAF